ncbi:hypothetical protein COE53_18070 [Bacillus sp. AFS029533]|nr:hypothetical protein COE53_18070 [Bacillus sp. AFS029533]
MNKGNLTGLQGMAEVISKIPYLSLIFKSKPLEQMIWEELKKRGYKIGSFGITYSPKTIHIWVDESESYYNEVKDGIKKTVDEILQSKGYNSYSVNITKYQERKDYELNVAEKKEKTVLESEITKKLTNLNYPFNMVQADPTEDTIFINMEGSKKYYNEVKRDVEQIAKEIAESNHYPGYKIKVTRVTVEVRATDKGSQIIPAIAEGLLSKKEYKVKGVGYKSKPLIIMISTSIQSSDLTAKELGMKIDKEINEYLKSEDILSILGDEKVKVIVYSMDKKKIN